MAGKYLGEMPGKASKGSPQVSSDLGVNRTMNLAWVLTSNYKHKVDVLVIAERSIVFYHV